MNKFEKVSFDTFTKAFNSDIDLSTEYNDIKLPKRATKLSAGYDIYTPFSFDLAPHETIKIPTGIKAHINKGLFLAVYVRSSMGFKYGINLVNGTGIVDGDYVDNPSNEGMIFVKLVNNNTEGKSFHCDKGDAIAQAIFTPYYLTEDDNTNDQRIGGIGSTGK